MERLKTGSMTHLTKILIMEELNKIIPELKERLENLEEAEVNDLENAGDSWNRLEDQLLNQELCDFIDYTAVRHKRSKAAIHARLKMIYDKRP